jgi:hypothetical protein
MTLSTREKQLIGLLAIVLLLAVLFLGVQRVAAFNESVERRIAQQAAMLEQASVLSARLSRISREERTNVRRASLIGHLEQLSGRTGLQNRVQLNPQTVTGGDNLEAADIRVDDLTLDELVQFIYLIEDSRPQLVIDRVDISPTFRGKQLLRLNLRVLAPKP